MISWHLFASFREFSTKCKSFLPLSLPRVVHGEISKQKMQMLSYSIGVNKAWATPRLVCFRDLILIFRETSPSLLYGSKGLLSICDNNIITNIGRTKTRWNHPKTAENAKKHHRFRQWDKVRTDKKFWCTFYNHFWPLNNDRLNPHTISYQEPHIIALALTIILSRNNDSHS